MIRVFVGCAVGEDAESQAVLEYSLRARATAPVEIVWMQQARSGFWSGWDTRSWATPFTGFRWGVPAFCNYRGRAIYMDSDVILRADIRELWEQDLRGAVALRGTEGKLRTCVMLLDCERLRDHLSPIASMRRLADPNGAARKYFSEHRELLQAFAGDWNCIDLKGYEDIDDPDIKLIHYSSMAHQPHLRYAIPRLAAEGRRHWYDGELLPHWRADLVRLFDETFEAAVAAGFTPDRYHATHAGPYRKKSWRHYKPKVSR